VPALGGEGGTIPGGRMRFSPILFSASPLTRANRLHVASQGGGRMRAELVSFRRRRTPKHHLGSGGTLLPWSQDASWESSLTLGMAHLSHGAVIGRAEQRLRIPYFVLMWWRRAHAKMDGI
jgi:hypothetical protein